LHLAHGLIEKVSGTVSALLCRPNSRNLFEEVNTGGTSMSHLFAI
jgi:hypothetical protein